MATVVRPFERDDDLKLLKELIHAAYALHTAKDLCDWGTYQTMEDTAKRLLSGQGFVAEADSRLIGTVTVRPPQPGLPVAMYRDADIWTISQLAAAPAYKGHGVGEHYTKGPYRTRRFMAARAWCF